jgi:hypothetical protein
MLQLHRYRLSGLADGTPESAGLAIRRGEEPIRCALYVCHVEAGLQLADPAELAIAQEYLSLKERVGEARSRADRLRALAEHLDDQAAQDEHSLRELEGVLGLAAQLQIEQLDRDLGGKRLQEIAVAVLAREIKPGQAVHYRDWYALLCAAGYRARGKDPLASFLSQINRAEGVEPIGGRSGQYRLRAA